MSLPSDPYCRSLPNQLRAWDATALRRVMKCPRYHQLVQLEAWSRTGNIDIEFGKLYHTFVEQFDKALLAGASKEEATRATIERAFLETQGLLETAYLPAWRCTSPALAEVTRGARKGELAVNRKRCPRAKGPQFDGGHREGQPCPDCDRPTVDDWEMVAGNKNKNRDTLLRTVFFYCDTSDERVRPWAFPDGRPAIELSFSLPLPILTPDGEPYLLTGSIDSFVEFAGEILPRERKTTKNTPGSYFFEKYAPDVQIDVYDLVTSVLFAPLLDPKPSGVMVEVTQCTKELNSIARQVINIPEERRAETLAEICWWIKHAEGMAKASYWPKNTSACNADGGCPFREVCRRAPSSRKHALAGESFVKREPWNPMEVR